MILALVIGDASPEGIVPFASEDPELVRSNLIEFYNQAVTDGGLRDTAIIISPDTDIEETVSWIEAEIGRTVVITETELLAA